MHNEFRSHVLEWIDHNAPDQDEIDRHLATCDACRHYFTEMRKLLEPGLGAAFPVLLPDPYFPTRVAAMSTAADASRRMLAVRGALQGAAVLLALIVGVVLGSTLATPPDRLSVPEIVSSFQNAVAQDDFSGRLEQLFETQEGVQQ